MKPRRLLILLSLGLLGLVVPALLVLHFTHEGHQGMDHGQGESKMHRHADSKQHDSPKKIARITDQETVFICPMHPDVHQSSAGSCPICRMALVQKKITSGAATEYNEMDHSFEQHTPAPIIKVSSAAQKAISLKTAKAVKRSLPSRIETIGKVAFNKDTTLNFVPRTNGWIDKLHVQHEGIRVNKGDKLLDFYSPEILVAQDGYVLSLKTNYSFSNERREYFDRIAQEKLRLYGMSPEMIEEIAATGELKQTITLQAPQAGVITTLDIEKGDAVTQYDRFMVIADLSSVWVNAALYEHQLPLLPNTQSVTVSSSAIPGKTWQGKIDYVAAVLDPKTNTLPIRVLVETPKELLKPNMQVDISLQGKHPEAVLTVPSAALIPIQRNQFRLVKANKGQGYQSINVVPGYRGTHFTEILSGLNVGDEVVTSGQFLLDSESSLQTNIRSIAHQH